MATRNKIIYWIATGWLALGMFSTGLVQLMQKRAGQGGEDMIAHLGYPAYALILFGILKMMGVLAILVPRYPLVKEWAYAGFSFLMTGAVFSHVASGDTISELWPSLLLLVLTGISWYFRPADRKPILLNRS